MQLALIVVFFAVGRWNNKTDRLIKASAIVLIIECLMVVLQRFGFDPFGFYTEMGFMDWNRRNLLGTMGNTNWLMGYEIIIIPILRKSPITFPSQTAVGVILIEYIVLTSPIVVKTPWLLIPTA